MPSRHLALDGIITSVRQDLGSDHVAPGATFSKLFPHTKTICPVQVLVDGGLLIGRDNGWPRGRQS